MVWSEEKISKFLNDLASSDPTPGGGGVSALVGALSAALVSMMANLTIGKQKFASVEQEMIILAGKLSVARAELEKLIDDDARAYKEIAECYKLPKVTEMEIILRKEKLAKAAQNGALIPLKICDNAVKILEITLKVAEIGNPCLLTDAGCGAILAMSAFECGELNVLINLPLTHNEEFITSCKTRINEYRKTALFLKNKVLEIVNAKL